MLYVYPHLGLQVMTFPKQLLIDDLCRMLNFYLLYSRKSYKIPPVIAIFNFFSKPLSYLDKKDAKN